MKAGSILLALLCAAPSLFAVERDRWISPDQKFLARSVSKNPDETGCRLPLSVTGKPELGILLRENDRWIRAEWSPDSRFLAVTDGSDGHVTDVFVYRVASSDKNESTATFASFSTFGDIAASATSPGLRAELWYHTPNIWTYDTRWEFAGWAKDNTAARLTKRTLGEGDKVFTVTLEPPTESKNEAQVQERSATE